jgi:hypothetical protein
VLSRMGLFPIGYIQPLAFLFQNFRHGAALHAPFVCDVLLANTRVLLVVEAYLLTLVIEQPLFTRLSNELLECFPSGIFEKWSLDFRPDTSPFSEAGNGRRDTMRGRDSAGAKARTGEKRERVSLRRNRWGGE